MSVTIFVVAIILFFAIEILYFKIADHYNIIDKPNHRSSHTQVTIRGGGIIFPAAILAYSIFTNFSYHYFLIGLLLISFISFLDDVKELSSKVRILFHLAAVALLFVQVGLFTLPFYWILLALIFVIGTINAINFMDGINGITGGYGLVTLAALYYINLFVQQFTSDGFILITILSVLVFNFFNFRKKAKCFAGDVGSVSLAFMIVFLILQLIIKAGNLSYLLLLLFYGLDAITTIVFRLIRKENIFDAHRSHYYQFLANEKQIPHLTVAILYMVVQGIFDFIIIYIPFNSVVNTLLFAVVALIMFVVVRLFFEGSKRLLGSTVQ